MSAFRCYFSFPLLACFIPRFHGLITADVVDFVLVIVITLVDDRKDDDAAFVVVVIDADTDKLRF